MFYKFVPNKFLSRCDKWNQYYCSAIFPHASIQIRVWEKWCTRITEGSSLFGWSLIRAPNGLTHFMSFLKCIMTSGLLYTLYKQVHALFILWRVILNPWGSLHFRTRSKNTEKDPDNRGNSICMNLVGKLIFWKKGQFKHFRRDLVHM